MKTNSEFIQRLTLKSVNTDILSGTLNSSEDVHQFLMTKVYDLDTMAVFESFYVLFFNRANKVIGYTLLSQGGITGTAIDVRLIFSYALLSNSTGLVLSHCHPSGSKKPSTEDISLTKKIIEAGRLLNIEIHDHIIVIPGTGDYYSFADEGKI